MPQPSSRPAIPDLFSVSLTCPSLSYATVGSHSIRINAYTPNGTVLLNPAFPSREGKAYHGEKDKMGKAFHDEIINR